MTDTAEELPPAGAIISVTFDQRVREYLLVRDNIKAIKERHEKELKDWNEAKEKLSAWFQKHFKEAGCDSVKTKAGTAYITTRVTASLADPESFMNFIIAEGLWELLDRRANATAVRDYVQDRGALPPGVNLNTIIDVGVRRAS